ncbi:beta-alanine-activating enzyme isoform X1 [Gracilinanus agilis]|uniref:beta-alanine-activating enzyme isoform X1 n=1 Tax=Gracilinanus agilis TaxID=191870 RepID=UPI001CFD633A|nr:beta-alanine-activating enzyme isoform X1 [Gracilinanus agilis]
MTLQEMVLQAAALYSDRTAVCFDGCSNQRSVYYTYKSVVNIASELSSFLQLHCNFEGIHEIGLFCYPGINLPSWILGILQVPAAYSPIDPDVPPELSAYFMKKCNLKYILVEKNQVDKFKSSYETWLKNDTITVDHTGVTLFELHWNDIDVNLMLHDKKENHGKEKMNNYISFLNSNEEKAKKYMDVRLQHCLAYVLHTSGTTGIPKIVRVPHSCIVPNIQHLQTLFEISQEDILFMASPLTFDPSVVEIFLALTSGASLLIVPNAVKMLPSKLATVLFNHHRVTVLQATPTLLRRFGSQLIKSSVLSATTSLRVLALGGEAFPSLSVLRSWREEGNKTQVFNVYGITEVSSWATCYRIPEEDLCSTLGVESPVQLGFPLLGTVVEVRDTNGLTVQEGEGQVFLGGEKRVCFLDDETTLPFGTMRATGDFVTVKGEAMFFLGRQDSQIKRHGKRINIEFVQQVAEGICQVEACSVIWYHQERLILFVVTKDDLGKDHILGELQKHLPSYAIPDDILMIEALPFTSHGKIDVSELTKIYFNYINLKPHSKLKGKEELWERLQNLWKSSLRLLEDPLEVPKDSLFLSNGGDSLKSLWFSNEIENMVGRSIPGLLEVILSCSILDIYNYILQAMFPGEDIPFSRSYCTKRKFSELNGEEINGRYVDQKPGKPVNSGEEQNTFIALSRGNQILFVNVHESLKNSLSMGQRGTEIGKHPSTSHDLISWEETKPSFVQNMTNESSLTVMGKMDSTEEISSIPQISEDENSVRASEKMKLCVKWKSDTGKCVDASPLIAVLPLKQLSATVYIGSHSHRIQAIDLYSGKVKWEQILGDRIESSACLSHCGNFIIVGCYNGLIYVLRSNNGKIHWIFATKDAIKSSATMDPSTGLIYVGSHDHHVYALDIYKETCVWKLPCEGTVFSSPCLNLVPYHLYIATLQGLLLALNPATGNRLWTYSCGKPLFSSPQCSLQYVSVGCVDGNLYCFNHMGQLVWQVSTNGPVFSSPCISCSTKQEIFFGSHDCFVYCYNMEGHFQWKFEATASIYATPFTFHNHNLSSEMLLAAASTDGKLWILDAKKGQLETVYKLPGEVFSSPVVWQSMLIIGCRDNYVYCLDLLAVTEK